MTKDGVLVVAHDRAINPNHCPGDPALLGQLIRDLTLAQIKTLDCGSKGDFAGQPGWVARPGAKMPTLHEVFDLVAASGDDDVRFNIETKISPTVDDTAPYDVFTAKLVKAIQDDGLQDRAMIQSFDWRTIRLAKRLDPRIQTVALVWQYAGRRLRRHLRRVLARGRRRRPVGDQPLDRRPGLVEVQGPRQARPRRQGRRRLLQLAGPRPDPGHASTPPTTTSRRTRRSTTARPCPTSSAAA